MTTGLLAGIFICLVILFRLRFAGRQYRFRILRLQYGGYLARQGFGIIRRPRRFGARHAQTIGRGDHGAQTHGRAIDRRKRRQRNLATAAERMVSKTFGGSCQIPLAAFATVDGATMRLRAMVATPDGRRIASADASGPADAPEALGRQIAAILQAQDAAAILAECKADAAVDE